MDPKLAKVSFAEYSAQWMANGGTRGRLAPRIREYYGDLLRLHILPSFDREAIGAIRNDDVRAWLAALSVDRPLQAAKAYRLLSTILATAVTDRRITVNPCNIRGAGVETTRERPLISPRDAHDLADTIAPEFRCLVLLAEFAQLRLGELLGLKVADVNLADRTVRVERQALEIGGQGRVVTEPKSAAGRRTVSVPDGLVVELSEHIDAHLHGWRRRVAFRQPVGPTVLAMGVRAGVDGGAGHGQRQPGRRGARRSARGPPPSRPSPLRPHLCRARPSDYEGIDAPRRARIAHRGFAVSA